MKLKPGRDQIREHLVSYNKDFKILCKRKAKKG